MEKRSGIQTSETEGNMTNVVLDVKSRDNENNITRMERQGLHDI